MKRELLEVLTMTAERAGYNKSVLVVGARGSGKTLVCFRARPTVYYLSVLYPLATRVTVCRMIAENQIVCIYQCTHPNFRTWCIPYIQCTLSAFGRTCHTVEPAVEPQCWCRALIRALRLIPLETHLTIHSVRNPVENSTCS